MYRVLPARGPWAVALALIAALCFPSRAAAQAPDLHVIIAADTDDRIGEGCYQDLVSIQTVFEKYKPQNRTMTLKVFAGGTKDFANGTFKGPNNLNQTAIKDYLNQIPLGDKTGVAFFFSGHGDYTTLEGHRMVIPGAGPTKDRLPNEEIFRAIAARKQPVRMIAVVSDACAPNVGALDILRKDPKAAARMAPRATGPKISNVLDDLFFKPGPTASNPVAALIDINGAAEHQLAYGPSETGGFFTVGFLDALQANSTKYADDANGDGVLTWHEIFPRAIKNTEALFTATNKMRATKGLPPLEGNDGKPQSNQTPQAFRLPDPGPNHKFRYSVGIVGTAVPDGGMKVTQVKPGTPAAGSVQDGDIIRSANGRSVRNFYDFAGIVDFAPSNRLELKVARNGQAIDINLTMKEN